MFCTYLLFWKISTYLFETLSLKSSLKKSSFVKSFKKKKFVHTLALKMIIQENRISCIIIQENKK